MAAPVAPVAAAVAPVAAVAAAGVSGVSGNAVGPQASRETVAGRASGTPLYRPRAGSLHRAEDGAATGLNSPGAVSARLAGRADVGVAPMPGTAAAERIAAERTTPAERAHAVAMAARESAGPGSSSQEVRLNRVRNRLRENTGTVSADGFLQALGPVAAMVSKHKAWVAAGVTAAVLAFVVWSSSSGAHPAAAAHVVATNGAVGAVATEAGGVAAPAASAAPAGSVRGDLRSSGEHTGVAAGRPWTLARNCVHLPARKRGGGEGEALAGAARCVAAAGVLPVGALTVFCGAGRRVRFGHRDRAAQPGAA